MTANTRTSHQGRNSRHHRRFAAAGVATRLLIAVCAPHGPNPRRHDDEICRVTAALMAGTSSGDEITPSALRWVAIFERSATNSSTAISPVQYPA